MFIHGNNNNKILKVYKMSNKSVALILPNILDHLIMSTQLKASNVKLLVTLITLGVLQIFNKYIQYFL